jgi:carbon storage regulator
MLVLTRKVNQRLKIGPDITILIVKCGGGMVRLGIEAPDHIAIQRPEIFEQPEQQGYVPAAEAATDSPE